MRADVVVGTIFPDYKLTDHTSKRRKLSDLQGPDPMILLLSRGGYCPKERRQAEGLVQLHREMEVGYSRLVTISTDNLLATNEYRMGVGAHWTFLSDPGRQVQKDLDIAEYTDPEHDPMIRMSSCSNLVSSYSRFTTATGFLADRPSKNFGKTCAPCGRNAVLIGISPGRN
jgi:peroxiredoxin